MDPLREETAAGPVVIWRASCGSEEFDLRLRSDFWVAAYLRTCNSERTMALLRRRGAAEAGAIFIKLDRLDGHAAVFGPAPQSMVEDPADRRFVRLHKSEWIEPGEAERRLAREIEFDVDAWIVEYENPHGDPRVEVIAG